MSYSFYKILHLGSLFGVFSALGAMVFLPDLASHPMRKKLSAIQGGFLLLAVVAGFGLLARLGLIRAWPLWVWIKLALWISIGVLPVFIKRVPKQALKIYLLVLVLGFFGAWVAQTKPGGVPTQPAPLPTSQTPAP